MSTGDIYTIAGDGKNEYGGEGLAATGVGISQPLGVALDSAGDLIIGETGLSPRARLVPKSPGNSFGALRSADDIYTIAGDGTYGFSGDTGLATGAQLAMVQGVSIDSGGSLVLADTGNNRIRFEPQATTKLFGGFQEGDAHLHRRGQRHHRLLRRRHARRRNPALDPDRNRPASVRRHSDRRLRQQPHPLPRGGAPARSGRR